MPKIDFDKVEEADDFSPLPNGQYVCVLSNVEEASTKHGDEMWKLRFIVDDGPYVGRLIFDNMIFSDAALKRVKLICSRLGLDVTGCIDLTPSSITNRTCVLTVETEEYEDNTGKIKKRNVVPFAGYERVNDLSYSSSSHNQANEKSAEAPHINDDDIPF